MSVYTILVSKTLESRESEKEGEEGRTEREEKKTMEI